MKLLFYSNLKKKQVRTLYSTVSNLIYPSLKLANTQKTDFTNLNSKKMHAIEKKIHFLEYGFPIYDEKSPIPFSVPDGQIRKNVDPKILQKSRKFSVKKLSLYLL